ncbi:MAG TPA: hypothetical protein VF715_07710 [Thermoleophilaceae bacterium]
MRPASLTIVASFLALALPASAPADGLPVPGVVSDDLVSLDGRHRFDTLPAGDGTSVARIATAGGTIRSSRFLAGSFVIPAVTLDGSSSGLSAGGERLVLIRPRVQFPQATTRLAILHAATLRPQRIVTLRGDYSFDAISRDGRMLYLIEYLSRSDPTRYAVRAYEPRSGRLSEPIVDPREPGEDMSGFPITRATSPDGRWAYTLYDDGDHPFVHALDTDRRTAACIDLPESLGGFLARAPAEHVDLTVGAGGRTLTVVEGGRPRAVIDTRTLRVSAPGARRAVSRTDGGGGGPWPLAGVAALTLVLSGGAAAAIRRRRARPVAASR